MSIGGSLGRLDKYARIILSGLLKVRRSLMNACHMRAGKSMASEIRHRVISRDDIAIFYGHNVLPSAKETAHGGIIKIQRLDHYFPNSPEQFNIMYLVSSGLSPDVEYYLDAIRDKGIKIVLNQNGVAYPAWKPVGWEATNKTLATYLHAADHVFYQSEFAQLSSDYFLGQRAGPSDVLYNAVDTTIFSPDRLTENSKDLVLLVVGSQYQLPPMISVLNALVIVSKAMPRTRLIIAGKIWPRLRRQLCNIVQELSLSNHIDFLPPFAQQEAPNIYRKADILLHTKIQDVCPGVVVEALACGLPVVYSMSGGVPELVGVNGGVGVITDATWERRLQPTPEAWAKAIVKVAEKHLQYAEAARQRAVDCFDLKPWVERQRQVFTELLEQG